MPMKKQLGLLMSATNHVKASPEVLVSKAKSVKVVSLQKTTAQDDKVASFFEAIDAKKSAEETISSFKDMFFPSVYLESRMLSKMVDRFSDECPKVCLQVQALALKTNLHSRENMKTSLISFYGEQGKLQECHQVFKESWNSLFNWNLMIYTLAKEKDFNGAQLVFKDMRRHAPEMTPNEWTLPQLFNLIPEHSLSLLTSMHAYTLKSGTIGLAWVTSAVMGAYFRYGMLKDAAKVMSDEHFSLEWYLPDPNTTLPDESVMWLKAAHAYIMRSGMFTHPWVIGSVIGAYLRNGMVVEGQKLLEENLATPFDIYTWNQILAGLAHNGLFQEVFKAFETMNMFDIEPSPVTFLRLLECCSHVGDVRTACRIYETMGSVYGVFPEKSHLACLVDALCRKGEVKLACLLVLKAGDFDLDSCWSIIGLHCRVHDDLQTAVNAIRMMKKPKGADLLNISQLQTILEDHIGATKSRKESQQFEETKPVGFSSIKN